MSGDVTVDLIHALIEHMRGARDDWASLAMVIDLKGSRVGGTHGFAYSADGTVSAVASRPSGIAPAVAAYLDSRRTPAPVAVLVQYERSSGKYEVTFEDDVASRWTVTPSNLERIREDLGAWSRRPDDGSR